MHKIFSTITENPVISILTVGLLLLAAIFRIFFLDLIEFKADEAISFYQTISFFQNPSLPQIGLVASTGAHNFPLFNYLLILLAVFFKTPIGLSFAIGLINALSVPAIFIIFRKFYALKTIFFVSCFIALSTYSIVLSRKIWAQDFILFFTVPLFYFMHTVFLKKNPKSIFWLFLFFSLLLQIHGSGLFLLLATILIFFATKQKIDFNKAALGFLTGFIFAIPFFFFQITSEPFCPDCIALIEYQSVSKAFDFEHFRRPFDVVNNFFLDIVLGKDLLEFKSNSLVTVLDFLLILESLLIVVGIFYVLRYQRKYLFLVLLLAIYPTLLFIFRVPAIFHYYAVLILPIFLIIGLAFQYIFSLLKGSLKHLGWGLFSTFIISLFLYNFLLFQFISQKQDIKGDYGPIFKLTDQKTKQSLSNYTNQPYYNQLQALGYIFIRSDYFHFKIGEYLATQNQLDQALEEFKLSKKILPDDISSAANIALIYIRQGDLKRAEVEIDLIQTKDATVAAQLKNILDQVN